VFTGLVSYAWYLWHWPLIALFRYQLERNPSGIEIAVLALVSFALAVLSWVWLEKPVRSGMWWRAHGRTFGVATAASLSLVALAAAGYASNGFIGRYPEAIKGLARDELATRPGELKCNKSAASIGDRCPVWLASDSAPGVLLWGDSHASTLRTVFRDRAEAANVSVAMVSQPACPPLTGAGRKRRHGRTDSCQATNEAVAELLRQRKFSDVVLVARWDYLVVGNWPFEETNPEQHYLRDDQSSSVSLDENKAVITRALKRNVEAVASTGARVWLLLEAPYVGYNTSNRLAREIMRGRMPDTMLGISAADHAKRSVFMRELAAGLPVTVIDPAEALCEGERCLAVAGGKPLYFDDNHLSIYGAARLAPLLDNLFSGATSSAERYRAAHLDPSSAAATPSPQ
jgi:hypothetical protein